jgi:polyhydroxyalkanoate synthesis repressor PhaR
VGGEAIEIRRYPNRRLYDRSRRRYVTLPEIEELVRGGRTVIITDARNGDDLTSGILTQILIERHPERLLPVALLHAMLRANELALDVVRASWRQASAALEVLARPGAGAAGAGPHHAPTPASPLDWMAALGLVPTPPAAPPEGSRPAAADEAMARRVAELEARLERLAPAPKAAPPAGRRTQARGPARPPATRRRRPASD